MRAKLKLKPIFDDKLVKVSLELPASVHRDLVAYAEILGRETGQAIKDPIRLIAPMLARFMETDRSFTKARARVRFLSEARDNAPRASSGKPSAPGFDCPTANKRSTPIHLAQRHLATPGTPIPRNSRRYPTRAQD